LEKSVRHGHISTLHVWWARRPLAACRAVVCAALWPDPDDQLCPQSFRDNASQFINRFASKAATDKELAAHCSPENWEKWQRLTNAGGLDSTKKAHWNVLRFALLDFIADFSNWANSTVTDYLETSQDLTRAAHEALGGLVGTKPMVIDPFAGGGSIPLEALRVGAEVFASDLNPVAVLLNKVMVEYIPKYGTRLAGELEKWGDWIKQEARKDLDAYFPIEDENAPPVAYLWARTILCDGPGCGAEVPIIRSLCLAKKGKDSLALRLVPDKQTKMIGIQVVRGSTASNDGTVKRGSVTCPVCGYTTPVTSVRQSLRESSGGADTSRLLAVVRRSESEKVYVTPSDLDLNAVEHARRDVNRDGVLGATQIPLMSGVFNIPIYGMTRWDLMFSARQLLVAQVFSRKIDECSKKIASLSSDHEFAIAVKVLLLMARDKYLDFRTTLCTWINVGEKIGHTFGRQALGMIFDWAEGTPFGDMSGSWERSVSYLVELVEHEAKSGLAKGVVENLNAQSIPLPDDSVQAFITDPPYYNAVPYADLSDFFYVWLRKDLVVEFPELFSESVTPKADELCEMQGWDPIRYPDKDAAFYEKGMTKALSEAQRICAPSGIAVIVFAHKSTSGWESLLSALIDSGWIVTSSWPIDTERAGRLRAMQSAALASSIHLVCRPRKNLASSSEEIMVGDWRDVLQELPQRIHEWLTPLVTEGVVGADAIFACLGPALEVFSRYSRVEKASGEQVTLKEYLEYVWAAVAKEALHMIFEGVDATGFEEDARLTAMWLWTVSAGINGNGIATEAPDEEEDIEPKGKLSGFALEYDAARKIAQGLGAHLERLPSLVEINGDTARLLPVSDRARYLFGKDEGAAPTKRKGKPKQLSFTDILVEINEEEGEWGEKNASRIGNTALDRIHQSMILFGAGRGEALKRFLVTDGAGQDQRFWSLAQALSALYPTGTEERRWVEGVLARKKGLGF
jgi:adenine-specific DNA methylase